MEEMGSNSPMAMPTWPSTPECQTNMYLSKLMPIFSSYLIKQINPIVGGGGHMAMNAGIPNECVSQFGFDALFNHFNTELSGWWLWRRRRRISTGTNESDCEFSSPIFPFPNQFFPKSMFSQNFPVGGGFGNAM